MIGHIPMTSENFTFPLVQASKGGNQSGQNLVLARVCFQSQHHDEHKKAKAEDPIARKRIKLTEAAAAEDRSKDVRGSGAGTGSMRSRSLRRSRRHRERRDSRPPLERRKQPRDDRHSGRKEKVDKGRPVDVKGLELKGEVETGAMSSEVHRGQKCRDERQKKQEKEKGKIQPSSRVESRGDSLEGQRRTRDPPPSSAARRRETTDVPIFAAGSRNVGQSGGAERSITLREGSPACSASTAGVPQRPIAPVALAAEGYVDVEGVYVIPPYKHGRRQYMTASTELQLATAASARSCGVPSVQELTTLVFGLLNEEKDSTQHFVKVDACLKKIDEVADDREKARLVALLFRRSNNALRHAHSKIMKRPDGKEVHDNGFPKLEVPGESEPHWLFVCPFVPHNPLMSTKREDLDMIDKLEQDDFLQKLDVTGLPDTIKRVLGFRDSNGFLI